MGVFDSGEIHTENDNQMVYPLLLSSMSYSSKTLKDEVIFFQK